MSKDIFDKVLYIAPHYKYWKGGISAVIVEYKNSIKNFHYLPSTTSANIYLTTLSFPFLVLVFAARLMISRKIKIVHIHGASKGSFYRKFIYFFLAKKLFKKKVVYHIHGAGFHLFYQGASSFIRRGVRYMINESDTLIVLSNWWKEFFSGEFKPKRIKIVPNIVANPSKTLSNINSFSNVENDKNLEKKVNLLFLGRIGDRKGIFDLLTVLTENLSFFKEKCHLKIGGDGDINKLLEVIRTNQLSEVVEYIGFVQGEKKIKVLNDTDIYILPSYNEGLPISILEAMSFAKPIISTTVGGIPEIVNDQYNGILFEPGDLIALNHALTRLVSDKKLLMEYGNNSYRLVKDKHFPDSVKESLLKVYQELI
ncbi:glycosyltransferase family 4 protein [Catalinimonas sp. 4WD22]|uniref:glycosyltransferase family 4 protein n=1 Tax=Catalinimonas locisalis TaxID=3133978 RepID=UPI003101AE38